MTDCFQWVAWRDKWKCMCKQGVQALFEECQATFDPNNIAGLLAQHPYHIDSLMAMYELHRYVPSTHILQRCNI